ncbi:RHS repeat-associated core domain-containing protein [Sedimentisphaera salicampi]|uniref:Cell wall-associated polypeptide CWBP200 n=1 Tax=Sedimentisphaera salicampi TaxID=1941349 RepID=A0A1W6LL99_9BACT|nr:RHS repeat-associated core domain-containing protein [Sedimentisphaera salicampi]ARN56568.1 hypothetical protein STSP1_00951 [Sedimentisphaera salicampi]
MSRFAKNAIGNPYMFTGRRYDAGTGLYYYRARMYSPKIARFLQTDPLGYFDTINPYAYCGNNPVNYIDPWGLYPDEYNPGGIGFPGGRGIPGGPPHEISPNEKKWIETQIAKQPLKFLPDLANPAILLLTHPKKMGDGSYQDPNLSGYYLDPNSPSCPYPRIYIPKSDNNQCEI